MPNASEISEASGLGSAHARYFEAYGGSAVVDFDTYASYRRLTSEEDRLAWREAFCEAFDEYLADQD